MLSNQTHPSDLGGFLTSPNHKMRSYFEAEMGLTYGKMPVPPKELCVSAGGWGVNLPRERSSSQWIFFWFGEAFYFEQKGYFISSSYIEIYSPPSCMGLLEKE